MERLWDLGVKFLDLDLDFAFDVWETGMKPNVPQTFSQHFQPHKPESLQGIKERDPPPENMGGLK